MLIIRKTADRGITRNEWLTSWHTFSFADYYDPNHIHFSDLRVINEDIIKTQSGFSMHPHSDMEIITYVISGSLEHRDSIGHIGTISAGEVQVMSAGSGILHSEYNPSQQEDTHLLQIWIFPQEKNLPPHYEQRSFRQDLDTKKIVCIAENSPQQKALLIHQDVKIYLGKLLMHENYQFDINPERKYWFQLIHGNLKVNEVNIASGDSLAIYKEDILEAKADDESLFILFDLR